jgi:hypothetical protein
LIKKIKGSMFDISKFKTTRRCPSRNDVGERILIHQD